MATAYGSAAAPVYGASGLIDSYSNSKKSGAQRPIYGASGLVTGYSTGDSNVAQPTAPTYNNPNDPAGYYNFNPVTGLNPQGLTKGAQAAKDYQASTQTVSNTKSAPIAAAASTTLGNENALQSNLVKSFSDYLNEAKQLQQTGGEQVKQDTAALNAAPAQLQSNLSKTVQDFANTTGALDRKVTDLNAANAKTVAGNIAQSQQNVADYGTAEEAVANQAIAQAGQRYNAAQSASGTPTSNSGYLTELAANTTAQIMTPAQLQIAQMKQQNLTNYISPQEQNLYANNIAQVTGLELPIAQTLVQYGITNANQVAQLQAQLSGKALNEQIAYLSSLGIPVQLAQQVAASLPGAIGALSSIDNANTFYGLAQDYQNPVAGGLPTYNPGTPGYGNRGPLPNTPYVQPGQPGGNPLPLTVTPPGSNVGAPVGINSTGQLVDANGNVVNYAAPPRYNGPSLPYPSYRPAPTLSGQPGAEGVPAGMTSGDYYTGNQGMTQGSYDLPETYY